MAYMSDARKILGRLEREALADAAVRTAAKRRLNQPSWAWTEPGYAEDMRGLMVCSLPNWKQQRAWAYWTGSEYLTRDQALALLAGKRVSLADVEPR